MSTAAEIKDEKLALEACELKFAPGENDKTGQIEGYASLFGELDQGNDIVERGAFKQCLKDRRVSRIPLFFGHAHNSVPIGLMQDLREDTKGLKFKAQLILESDLSRQVRAILLAGGEMGVSIGYRTKKAVWRDPKGKEFDEWTPGCVRLLQEVELREISLTAMPMLDSARITGVKSEGDLDDATRALIRTLERHADDLDLLNALDRAAGSLAI